MLPLLLSLPPFRNGSLLEQFPQKGKKRWRWRNGWRRRERKRRRDGAAEEDVIRRRRRRRRTVRLETEEEEVRRSSIEFSKGQRDAKQRKVLGKQQDTESFFLVLSPF